MTRNTIVKGDKTTTQTRYFISSLPLGVEEAARAIRGLDGGKLPLAS